MSIAEFYFILKRILAKNRVLKILLDWICISLFFMHTFQLSNFFHYAYLQSSLSFLFEYRRFVVLSVCVLMYLWFWNGEQNTGLKLSLVLLFTVRSPTICNCLWHHLSNITQFPNVIIKVTTHDFKMCRIFRLK